MNPLKEFKIPYIGLKVGKHQFQFEIGETFFETFEYPDLDNGQLEATLELNKQETMITIESQIKGELFTFCDRCNDKMSFKYSSEQTLFVKFGETTMFQSEDVLILAPSEDHIDLSRYIFEILVLNLPSKKTHKLEEDCNQDIIAYLNEQEEIENEEINKEIDPRWQALKGLK